MKDELEQKYIDDLIRHTNESIRFFSNVMKSERERSVCAALLRCLGIKFLSEQIQAKSNDPPDVIFKSACFEVMELYDKRRKRLDEYWERLKELEKAKSISDTLVPFHQPIPISYRELRDEIIRALDAKSRKYGKELCSTLDALVYIGLPNIFLDIRSKIPEYAELTNQGWRSVAFVLPPFGHVAFCKEDGPQFLTPLSGQTKQEWKSPDGFFDLARQGDVVNLLTSDQRKFFSR
ncbi:MAG: DUF1780 domain-containing protein [Syntrophales bacterium]|nr:DUF1780 domain-containing protein [Syntrophales bacterium]